MLPSELREISRTQVQKNFPHPLKDALDLSPTPIRGPLPRPNTTPLFPVFTPCPPELGHHPRSRQHIGNTYKTIPI
jgi:hypothetical protein